MKKEGKILIVDDNKDILISLERLLGFDFLSTDTLQTPNTILKTLGEKEYDVILMDMNFKEFDSSGQDGIFWLKKIISVDPSSIVIMITAYGDINLAVTAMKEGAIDFVTKPWEPNKLIATIRNAIGIKKAQREIKDLKAKNELATSDINRNFDPLIGSSQAMKKVYETIAKVAKTDANVLILGENGTGKELIAREIHNQSNRNQHLFLNVDLSSLNDNLFESELFGHVKGAFTDAKADKIGRFELASEGTLFLDEIGNIPLSLQSKLLNILQQRTVMPVGGTKPKAIDIRLISATNKDIFTMIGDHLFREDLLYRINTITLTVPPLRDRADDIVQISDYFVKKYGKQYQKENLKINSKAYLSLQNYSWPGNIRELKHTIEKAVILDDDGIIKPEDLFYQSVLSSESKDLFTLDLNILEKTALERAISKSSGNISKASKMLGISRTSLYSKMKKYGL